jgi:hypothetical protein
MRILICGGRSYYKKAFLFYTLDKIRSKYSEMLICHGDAPGADYLASMWAKERNIPCFAFPAKWNTYGRSAGPIRNRQMIDEFKPELVVAFPGGKGTENMIHLSKQNNVPVIEITDEIVE